MSPPNTPPTHTRFTPNILPHSQHTSLLTYLYHHYIHAQTTADHKASQFTRGAPGCIPQRHTQFYSRGHLYTLAAVGPNVRWHKFHPWGPNTHPWRCCPEACCSTSYADLTTWPVDSKGGYCITMTITRLEHLQTGGFCLVLYPVLSRIKLCGVEKLLGVGSHSHSRSTLVIAFGHQAQSNASLRHFTTLLSFAPTRVPTWAPFQVSATSFRYVLTALTFSMVSSPHQWSLAPLCVAVGPTSILQPTMLVDDRRSQPVITARRSLLMGSKILLTIQTHSTKAGIREDLERFPNPHRPSPTIQDLAHSGWLQQHPSTRKGIPHLYARGWSGGAPHILLR